MIVDRPYPNALNLVVVSAFTVVIVARISPVAATESVVVTDEKPNALATVPVKVPPSICSLPAASIFALPPRLCICDMISLIVVLAFTFNAVELKYIL